MFARIPTLIYLRSKKKYRQLFYNDIILNVLNLLLSSIFYNVSNIYHNNYYYNRKD